MAIETSTIEGFLSTREGCLVRRESQILEFKRSFTFAALAEYFRDFAAFANNRGGYILFGVEDSPRHPTGLSESALERFSSIDPRRITEPLLSLFAPVIDWEAEVVEVEDKSFGVFRVEESSQKPVVAKKNQGDVKDGEIYYRYRGQTRKIRHEELSRIIAERIARTNNDWRDVLKEIGRIGASHVAVLDTTRAVARHGDTPVLAVDDVLGAKLGMPHGQYVVREGSEALVDSGQRGSRGANKVILTIPEKLTEAYPYAAMEMARRVKQRVPGTGLNRIWATIREQEIKEDQRYSAYVFRNKEQERQYEQSGVPSAGTPSIYNDAAVEFISDVIEQEDRSEEA